MSGRSLRAPSFFEQYRLEAVVASVLRRALRLERKEHDAETELASAVRQEIARLHRELGADFLRRVASSSLKSVDGVDETALPSLGEAPDDEVSPAWPTLAQRKEAEAALWLAKLHGVASIREALEWHIRCNGSAERAPSLRECVDEFHLAKRSQGCAHSTLAVYRLRLNPFVEKFGDRRPGGILGKEIADYLSNWTTSSTRLVHWEVLSTLFNWMWSKRYVMENPLPKAMRRPKKKETSQLIFTPAEARHVLRLVKGTDQLGFWVLSLFAGMRRGEIQRLENAADPWRRIDLIRRSIDWRDDPVAKNRRTIPIIPVLRAWLKVVKKEGGPFYPKNHWEKFRLVRAQVLAGRGIGRERSQPIDRTDSRRSFAMARRSYISYRLALTGASFARVSDDVGYSETFVRNEFYRKASESEAREYFSAFPESI